jgi:hypothetical protein
MLGERGDAQPLQTPRLRSGQDHTDQPLGKGVRGWIGILASILQLSGLCS